MTLTTFNFNSKLNNVGYLFQYQCCINIFIYDAVSSKSIYWSFLGHIVKNYNFWIILFPQYNLIKNVIWQVRFEVRYLQWLRMYSVTKAIFWLVSKAINTPSVCPHASMAYIEVMLLVWKTLKQWPPALLCTNCESLHEAEII